MLPLYVVKARPVSQHRTERFDRLLLTAVCAALGGSALTMGGVLPVSLFLLRSAAVLVFLGWAFAQLLQGNVPIAFTSLYKPMLAFLVLVVVQLLAGVTAYRHATLVELLNYVTYGLLAFVIIQTFRESHAAKWLALGVSAFGLAVAVFALLQYFASNGKLYWVMDVPADALWFGPYVNHNHYAGLMEMLIAFPLVFALKNQISLSTRLFFAFSAVVIGVSVIESGSRGGMGALLCQVVLLAILGLITKMNRGAIVALLLVLVAMAALLAILVDSGVITRVTSLREPGRADVSGWRMTLNRDSLAMVRAKPILGWGLGAFPVVYPTFRSFYDDAPIEQAHDDYMQLLVETGVAGGLITLWFLVVMFRENWHVFSQSQDVWDKGITLGAMISVAGILVHSASDFNLHIPANAAIFFVMCALAVVPIGDDPDYPTNEMRRPSTKLRAKIETESHIESDVFPQRLRVLVRKL